jgi:hypothetical protein
VNFSFTSAQCRFICHTNENVDAATALQMELSHGMTRLKNEGPSPTKGDNIHVIDQGESPKAEKTTGKTLILAALQHETLASGETKEQHEQNMRLKELTELAKAEVGHTCKDSRGARKTPPPRTFKICEREPQDKLNKAQFEMNVGQAVQFGQVDI